MRGYRGSPCQINTLLKHISTYSSNKLISSNLFKEGRFYNFSKRN